jgi:prolyl-tRNA synthetase
MEVNETKLANAVRAKSLRMATDEEIRAKGMVPGYGSAIGITGVLVAADDAIPGSPNLVAGANEAGYHYLNTNISRDYQANIVADIAAAREGDLTPGGGGVLRSVRGVEVGNIFKLGTRYSAALGATFLDKNGEAKPVIMGSYGIGIGRLLACIAEECSDERGLILPISVAPYQVCIVLANSDDERCKTLADEIYTQLLDAGIEVLYDDRDERTGVKFNDADLLGIPLRLTVGAKALAAGGVELKRRDAQQGAIIPVDQLLTVVQQEIRALFDALAATVVPEPFKE